MSYIPTFILPPIINATYPISCDIAGNQIITIYGLNFLDGYYSKVLFGGIQSNIISISDTVIKCVAPANPFGLTSIKVINADGQISNSFNFTYTAVEFDISGLALLLDAQNIGSLWQDSSGTVPVVANNDPIGNWTDQSTSGNTVIQASSSLRPLYKTKVFGNLPGVQGDGVDDILAKAAANIGGAGGMTIALVGYLANNSLSNPTAVSFNSDQLKIFSSGTSGSFSVKEGLSTKNDDASTTNINNPRRIIYTVASGSTPVMNFWRDGVQQVASVINGTTATSSSGILQIFNNSTSLPGNFIIGEVVVYNRAINTIEVALLDNILKTKWGLPIISPTISLVNRSLGDAFGGSVLTLTVNNSAGITAATCCGVAMTSITAIDSTHIQATTGAMTASLTPGDITVSNIAGTGTLSNAFTPWSPTLISSKIAYWLRADLGVNTGAHTWTDQINSHVFSATTISTDTSGLNGKARIIFSASPNNTLTSSISISATQGQAFAIGKSATTGGGGDTTSIWEIGSAIGSYFQYTDGNIYEGGLNTGRYTFANPLGYAAGTFAYEIKADASGNWSARMNGSTIDTQTGNTIAWNSTQKIGAGAVVNHGELEEILVCTTQLTSGEHANYAAYILDRYGIVA